MRVVSAFGAGLLFGLGLCISGMVDPRKVIGFLDFTGQWDPSLALVMVGAIGVHATLLRVLRKRAAALHGSGGPPGPARRARVQPSLVLGSALFGLGWGIAGYCPGPAIVSLGSGTSRAFGFVAAMLVGSWITGALVAPPTEITTTVEASSQP